MNEHDRSELRKTSGRREHMWVQFKSKARTIPSRLRFVWYIITFRSYTAAVSTPKGIRATADVATGDLGVVVALYGSIAEISKELGRSISSTVPRELAEQAFHDGSSLDRDELFETLYGEEE